MRIIPKEKISDLRFGQLLINALVKGGYLKQFVTDNEIGYRVSRLDPFYIENDELESIVQDFLGEYTRNR